MEFDKKTERILDIYFRLSKGMVLNKKELADSYGVNPRSIQRDLDDIRCYLANNGEYGTELVYDREAKGFRLIRTDINTLSNSQMLTVCKILIESRALVKEEMENGSEGILFVYPEMYLEKKEGGYKKNNLLAVTDTMQSEFKYYAATLKSKKEQYRLPVEDAVLEQVRNGEKPFIYVENTYRLGYESMQMLEKKGKTKDMKNICLKPVRLDKERMESGEYDALLSR